MKQKFWISVLCKFSLNNSLLLQVSNEYNKRIDECKRILMILWAKQIIATGTILSLLLLLSYGFLVTHFVKFASGYRTMPNGVLLPFYIKSRHLRSLFALTKKPFNAVSLMGKFHKSLLKNE